MVSVVIEVMLLCSRSTRERGSAKTVRASNVLQGSPPMAIARSGSVPFVPFAPTFVATGCALATKVPRPTVDSANPAATSSS